MAESCSLSLCFLACSIAASCFLAAISGSSVSCNAREESQLTGTWTCSIDFKGKQARIYMRLDPRSDYRMWDETSPSSSCGTYTFDSSMLYIRKNDGTQMTSSYSLPDANTLVLKTQSGRISTYKRASDKLKAPGENSAPLNPLDMANPQKCFDEGKRLYKLGDMRGAFAYFLKAANLGGVEAQLQTGWHYEKGAGTQKNMKEAASFYKKAAEAGNATAMKNLGQLYENGTGVPEDWQQAFNWYQKSAAKADSSGEDSLATAYRFGIGVPQNRQLAIHWYKKAAEHGRSASGNDVRWLSDPTNNIGFRNETERGLVLAGQLRTSFLLCGADPAGIAFRNSGERLRWLNGLRNRVDTDEAESRRLQAEASKQRHESEVKRLESQGYDHYEAERRAGW